MEDSYVRIWRRNWMPVSFAAERWIQPCLERQPFHCLNFWTTFSTKDKAIETKECFITFLEAVSLIWRWQHGFVSHSRSPCLSRAVPCLRGWGSGQVREWLTFFPSCSTMGIYNLLQWRKYGTKFDILRVTLSLPNATSIKLNEFSVATNQAMYKKTMMEFSCWSELSRWFSSAWRKSLWNVLFIQSRRRMTFSHVGGKYAEKAMWRVDSRPGPFLDRSGNTKRKCSTTEGIGVKSFLVKKLILWCYILLGNSFFMRGHIDCWVILSCCKYIRSQDRNGLKVLSNLLKLKCFPVSNDFLNLRQH